MLRKKVRTKIETDNTDRIRVIGHLYTNLTLRAANPSGFHALAEYDKPENGGNNDGVINSRDSVFAILGLWKDTNHNSASESGELHTLADRGITSISLDYNEALRRNRYGNSFKYRGKVSARSR